MKSKLIDWNKADSSHDLKDCFFQIGLYCIPDGRDKFKVATITGKEVFYVECEPSSLKITTNKQRIPCDGIIVTYDRDIWKFSFWNLDKQFLCGYTNVKIVDGETKVFDVYRQTSKWELLQYEPTYYGDIVWWECQNCGMTSNHRYAYCPHCGTRMEMTE